MIRKLRPVAAVIAVLACAAPSPASAAQMTEFGGGTMPVGTVFEGSSTNTLILTEGLGTVSCGLVRFQDRLTGNSGGVVRALSESFGFGLNCSDSEEVEADLPQFELLSVRLAGPESGEGVVEGELILAGFIECRLFGTVAISYSSGSHSLHLEGEVLAGGCGEAFVEGDFELSTTGSSIVLD